jgi:hypothetical protein
VLTPCRPDGHSGGITTNPQAIDTALRARLSAACADGWRSWERFEAEVRDHEFHPFVAADYEIVLKALLPLRGPGLRFLEWGSASGVITVMADLMGFEACGIELDPALVAMARELASKHDSGARFVVGSLLPTGYRWEAGPGGGKAGTLGAGPSGYLQLGLALDDFDVVFGYPWGGEAPLMLDLMRQYGRADALLLLYDTEAGVRTYRGGREVVAGGIGRR